MKRDYYKIIQAARQLINKRKFYQAICLLNQAIEIYPYDPYPYNRKGFIYLQLKDYHDSIECYKKAIKLGMKTHDVFGNIALAKYYVGWYEEALKDVEYALGFGSESYSVYNTKGLILNGLGEIRRAIDEFTNAISFGNRNAQLYRNRGKSYLEIGSLNEALKDLNTAIEIDPSYNKSYITRGLIYEAANRDDKAIADFKRANALNPSDLHSNFNLANSYFRLGEYENAYNYLVVGEDLCKNDSEIQKYSIFIFTALSYISSPFLLYRLIRRIYRIDTFLSFQHMIQDNFEHCMNLITLLDYLDANESLQVNHYQLYKGVINYFMKDPSTCYKIFDEKVDVDDSDSLMGQYYYMLSCNNYLLSEKDSVFTYATMKAREYLKIRHCEDDSDQLYYAGQILYLTENFPEALICFTSCEDFIPALCMRIMCLNQLNEIDKRDKLIVELLMLDRHNDGLLQYIEIPSIRINNFENSIHLFSYIHEIEGVIPILIEYSEDKNDSLKDYGNIIEKIGEVFTLNEDRIEGKLSIDDVVLWRSKLQDRVCQETEDYFWEYIKDHFIAWQNIDDPDELEHSIGREIPFISKIPEVRKKMLHLVDYFDVKKELKSEARYMLRFWSEICFYKARKLTEPEKRALKISINGLFKIAIGSFSIPYFVPTLILFLGYQISKDKLTRMIIDFVECSFVKDGEQIPNFYSEFKEQFELYMQDQLGN